MYIYIYSTCKTGVPIGTCLGSLISCPRSVSKPHWPQSLSPNMKSCASSLTNADRALPAATAAARTPAGTWTID